MSDEEIQKLLEETLSSKCAPPLTNEVVDAFLATSTECSQEAVDRMRARFVEKILGEIHEEPVKKVDEQPFGRWIETVRKKARLGTSDIATAIGKDSRYIERLETGNVWPWSLDPRDIASLVSLFRIHISTLSELIKKSFALSQARLEGEVRARAHGGKATRERGDSTKRALDLFLARNAKSGELSPQVTDWLRQVRKDLEGRQAKELLE